MINELKRKKKNMIIVLTFIVSRLNGITKYIVKPKNTEKLESIIVCKGNIFVPIQTFMGHGLCHTEYP